MKVIGILGGVASGKSLVAGHLVSLGAGLLDADQAGREVLRMPDIEAVARRRWGPAIFGADGRIDRARLAAVVFADPPAGPRERRYLEQITHPEILRRLVAEKKRLEACGIGAAIFDVPLLLEAGWDKLCSALVFVDTPRQFRMARAMERGWSEADFTAREKAQESLDVKRARADVVVDNSGSPGQTRAQVERFWHSLVN